MYDNEPGRIYRSRYEAVLKLYAYVALILATLMFFSLIAFPIGKWILAAAELQAKNVQIQELELDRQKFLFLHEVKERGSPPERVVIQEVVVREIEPSWLSSTFYKWIAPILGILLLALGVAWVILQLYVRFGSKLVGQSQTTLSVLSASVSIAGMVFAAIKYQAKLLEHEVGAYLFLSCLYALIFFSLLLGTRVKLLSIAIYFALLAVTVLVGWFTDGSPMAVLNEYQQLLSTLTIPHQTLIVLGTALPIMLVTSSLLMKPDGTVTATF